jgi:hypothetical protein
MDKNQFLTLVTNKLYDNPDWLAETQQSIQHGLESRLKYEREQSTNLAYAMSYYVDECPKITEKFWDNGIKKGIESLFLVFQGSQFGNKLDELLDNHNKENK